MDRKVLLYTTLGPSFIIVILTVSEKLQRLKFATCSQTASVYKHILWPWPWSKVTETYMAWKVLSHTILVPSFKVVGLIVWEKCQVKNPLFSHLFKLLWPWPWSKVTLTHIERKVLPYTTMVPSFMNVVPIASEKLPTLKFVTDGRSMGGYNIDSLCWHT